MFNTNSKIQMEKNVRQCRKQIWTHCFALPLLLRYGTDENMVGNGYSFHFRREEFGFLVISTIHMYVWARLLFVINTFPAARDGFRAQGCQMVYFQTRNPNLSKFWSVLQWQILVYFMDIWSFYGHLKYFMDIWSILRTFEIFYGHLVYFMDIWNILWTFGTLGGNLVYFYHFGNLNQEKSGNPASGKENEIEQFLKAYLHETQILCCTTQNLVARHKVWLCDAIWKASCACKRP
jgi:hypothetical protein